MHFSRFCTGLGPWLALLAGLTVHAGPIPSSKPTAYPDWWFEWDVIPRKSSSTGNSSPVWPTDYETSDDYAVANIGQLKYVVAKAAVEMAARLPGGVGPELTATINSWSARPSGSVVRDDFAAVNQGQLKAMALPFYQRLQSLGYSAPFPWTTSTVTDDDDYALVNLGQLKFAFGFSIGAPDPTGDQDGDLLPDSWEWSHFGSLVQTGDDDSDGDGYSNRQEQFAQTNPADRNDHPSFNYRVISEGIPNDLTTFATIRGALLAASANPDFSIIQVDPGHYTGVNNTDLTNLALENVLLISEKGPGLTFIDGEGSLASGIVLGSGAVLSGFSLLSLAHGVALSGNSPRINHCIIRDVPDYPEAAIAIHDSNDFLIQDTTVEQNETRAVFVEASAGGLSRVILRQNHSSEGGGALLATENSAVHIENSLATANSATDSGGAFALLGSSTSLTLDSCTVLANQGRAGQGALVLGQGQSVTIINSIFWNEDETAEFGWYRTGLTVGYSLIRGGFDGPGNVNADPLLSEAGVPASNSPVIDHGPLVSSTHSDLYGQARPSGLSSDIGAVELQNSANTLPAWWQLQYFGATGQLPGDDADGDGMTNLAEFLAGTDPTDSLNGRYPVVTVVSGQNQHGTSGDFLPEALAVVVTSFDGRAAPDIPLLFQAEDALAWLSTASSGSPLVKKLVIPTDSNGSASAFVKP